MADDLPALFEFQLDTEANHIAAALPRSSAQFDTHWEKILKNPGVTVKAVLFSELVAGSISCFKSDGVDSIGYWIGREFWGRGVATRALHLLLGQVSNRPLHARVAVSNLASIRVLQKNDFVTVGHQHAPSDDRFQECDEVILELSEDKHG